MTAETFEPYIEYRIHPSKVYLKTPLGEEVFIEIAPGTSFGAEHPTTRLCLQGIREIFLHKTIDTALDLGCGSGILAISAAALGARRVIGVDIDPIAAKEAESNVKLNGMDSRVRIICGSLEDAGGEFDLTAANIVSKDLVAMRENLKSSLHTGGALLLSGISELKQEDVISGFCEIGFSLKRAFHDGGWVALWLDL